MMENTKFKNKQLAKNTIILYFRTIIVMLISLYTSRVVLNELGVDDYGIYNVVGGTIAMFGIVSGSIANAISRFITYELGKNDQKNVNDVFCTSINIQIVIALFIFLIGETVGLWFLNNQMNIPQNRYIAANWVFHSALISFVINLISLPYNACVIAHEKMSAFAYIGMFDAFLKLIIVIALPYFLFDKLIVYSLLLVLSALIICLIYVYYCKYFFDECHYHLVLRKKLIRKMAGFSIWQFVTNTCWIVNNQGLNILSNIYFGVSINAARGIATQVDGAINHFVGNFTTALNPQIVKSYAAQDKNRLFNLICMGAKYSYFMFLIFAIPVFFEAEVILQLWLKQVPDNTLSFLRIVIIASMTNMLGNTSVMACQATGDLKLYAILVSIVGYMVFPLTWILFEMGFPAEAAYYCFALLFTVLIFVRLYVMNRLINFPPSLFVRQVLAKIVIVTMMSLLVPFSLVNIIPESIGRLLVMCIACTLSSVVCIFLLGLTKMERNKVSDYIKKRKSILKR